jgi:ketosteroid isomerase-like protein
MPERLTEEEALAFLQKTVDAYEAGSDEFFGYFAPDASVFVVSTPTRIDGRDVFREGFGPYFFGTERISQILSPEVRLLGDDAAMLSFHNRILVKGVSANIRGTMVIARDDQGELKVVHLHNSPLVQAPITVAPVTEDLNSITVLEERVAAASAMTGTPK